MKAQVGLEIQPHSFLTSALGPGRFTPEANVPVIHVSSSLGRNLYVNTVWVSDRLMGCRGRLTTPSILHQLLNLIMAFTPPPN